MIDLKKSAFTVTAALSVLFSVSLPAFAEEETKAKTFTDEILTYEVTNGGVRLSLIHI